MILTRIAQWYGLRSSHEQGPPIWLCWLGTKSYGNWALLPWSWIQAFYMPFPCEASREKFDQLHRLQERFRQLHQANFNVSRLIICRSTPQNNEKILWHLKYSNETIQKQAFTSQWRASRTLNLFENISMSIVVLWSHILLPFVYFDLWAKKIDRDRTWLLQTRLTLEAWRFKSPSAQDISFDIHHP